ncbi:metallophosphoesterase family protein [candidate division WOR-3 bacterium]|nr:metallophosphoesterase family protein [candidate division WOR-3 bacterium]
MDLLAITDIHGRKNLPEAIKTQISNADLIVIAGDITNFGGYNDARDIIHTLTTINDHIVAVPGNCDRITVNKYLIDNDLSLHMATRVIQNIALYGIGGSGKTPFHTPQEYSEEDITMTLQAWEKQEAAKWHVLVTHSPPAHTKLDRTIMGLHVGSKVIRSFIETFEPDLVICGHIHEGRGIDYINTTLCINPGTFPQHAALISFNDSMDFSLY